MSTRDMDGMIAVLKDAAATLRRPGNDFSWSSWNDQDDALNEIEGLVALLRRSSMPERSHLEVLFAPTGPIQEVSLSSGWGREFLMLAERFDTEIDRIMPDG